MAFLNGHFNQDANTDLVYKESPGNIGIYIGNVANYNSNKGHITLNLNDDLKIGDTVSFENEPTKYKISELMIGKKNIDYAVDGQLVTIGRMKGNIHPSDKIFKLESKTLLTKAKTSYATDNRKSALSCKIFIHKNTPITICVYNENDINLKITSSIIPEPAVKQPISEERIISQFSKTGNTPFYFKNFDIDLDDNLYINISDLNELRRNCLEQVSNSIIERYKRTLPKNVPNNISFSSANIHLCPKTVSILLNLLDENINYSELESVDRVYIPLNYFAISNYSNVISTISKHFNTYIYMPTIIKSNYKNLYTSTIDKAIEQYDIKGFVVSNLGTLPILDKYKNNFEFIGNYTLNVYNTYSLQAYNDIAKFSIITLSPELSKNDIINLEKQTKLKTELIVYGKTPVMTMGYCVLGRSNKCYPQCHSLCKKSNSYYLKDRLGFHFRILIDNIQTITTVYNSKISSLDYSNLSINSVRIDFLDENISEMNNVIKTIKSEKRLEGKNYTNANFTRQI